jgi:hypothetical protein
MRQSQAMTGMGATIRTRGRCARWLNSAVSGRPRGATCTQPYVKGLVTMVNSIYNDYRVEDVRLDK